MPHGLLYEGVSEQPMAFSGGSAAQSSVLHAFDELLGIQHSQESSKSSISPFYQNKSGTAQNQPTALPVVQRPLCLQQVQQRTSPSKTLPLPLTVPSTLYEEVHKPGSGTLLCCYKFPEEQTLFFACQLFAEVIYGYRAEEQSTPAPCQ